MYTIYKLLLVKIFSVSICCFYSHVHCFMCVLLSLQGVSAGTSGATALAKALMTNQTLQTLEWVQGLNAPLLFWFNWPPFGSNDTTQDCWVDELMSTVAPLEANFHLLLGLINIYLLVCLLHRLYWSPFWIWACLSVQAWQCQHLI